MKKNNFNKWGIAIILCAIIGAIGTVAYFYFKQKTQKIEQKSTLEKPEKEIGTVSEPVIESVEIEPKVEAASAEVVMRGPNEGWLPIEALFDEKGLLKSEYYSQNPQDSDVDKLPYSSNKIGDFKWRAEFHPVDDFKGDQARFKDQCFGYCVLVKGQLLTSVESTVFTGAFIAKDHLIEVIAHKGSGAYMPVNYSFIKIDKAGNAELISDDHNSYKDQLARINHSGLEIDLKPFRKLQYFLLMNENGLNVSMQKPNKVDVEPTQCKEYYEGTLEACPTLYGCKADIVVQDLARAYAGDVAFSYHDPNIDEKKFNEVCFKVCRNENVSYEEFENTLCKVN